MQAHCLQMAPKNTLCVSDLKVALCCAPWRDNLEWAGYICPGQRGYRSLSYSILKLNQEYEKRLHKVGHCLQRSFSCSCAVGGHYFDYCQVLVIARTVSYIITLTMNLSNVIYSIGAPRAKMIILTAIPHAWRLNVSQVNVTVYTKQICRSYFHQNIAFGVTVNHGFAKSVYDSCKGSSCRENKEIICFWTKKTDRSWIHKIRYHRFSICVC